MEIRGHHDELVESMMRRLRPLCAGWPEEDFARMVRNLARITVKYEQIAIGEMPTDGGN